VTPLQFETQHGATWRQLAEAIRRMEGTRRRPPADAGATVAQPAVDAALMAQWYRATCEHLAMAQARAYPIVLTARLEQLTYRAHRLIYRHQDFGLGALRRLLLVDIPQSVRLHRRYLLLAVALFLLPTLGVGWATYRDPTFALHVLDVRQLNEFRSMYESMDHGLGARSGVSDWSMFGFYILNNISIGFQCFAGGLFAGVGSAFFLFYNGLYGGAAAGYLTSAGLATNFFSFIVTHSAFELTAICLSGAAGLRLGHAVVVPGRRSRLQSLRGAAADAVVLIYAVFAMLLVAAAIEAFWSSARWVPAEVKFGIGSAAWAGVIAYLAFQGRPRAAGAATAHSHAG
jgi:uncharacterized membrane protein SpoIIM required for sporulation